MGQGSDTGMAQIVGEALNIPAEKVRVVARDTDVTPYDMGTLGSRSLFHMGNATRIAAEEVRSKIAALASEVGEPEGSNMPIGELFKKKYGMLAGNIIGTSATSPTTGRPTTKPASRKHHPVLDDRRCGRGGRSWRRNRLVRIVKLVNVVDCGAPIIPIVERRFPGRRYEDRFHDVQEIEYRRRTGADASLADYKSRGIFTCPT